MTNAPAHTDFELLSSAASMGTSLDVDTTARRLAALTARGLGGIAIVNLARAIGDGEEPPERTAGGGLLLRRAAVSPEDRDWPEGYLGVGEDLPPVTDERIVRRFRAGEGYRISGRRNIVICEGEDVPAAWAGVFVPIEGDDEALSVICDPLVTEGVHGNAGLPGLLLGDIEVWRKKPFTDADARLLRFLAAYAAISIDNARRFTREHRLALILQRSLLPQERGVTTAGETAGVYLPAGAGGGLGGDWFDVIPLSSARVALVVGDVVGHGVRAAAAMGRLCTAVRTLADLDLAPDELLTHLDDLVIRLAEGIRQDPDDASGSTCVYAVVDPVARRCAVASAGHPPPAVVRADGTVRYVDLVPGPVLGVGGLTFEVTEFDLEDGDVLALYSNGLVEHRGDGLAQGMEALRAHLAEVRPTEGDLHDAATRLVGVVDQESLIDDVTLLLARVHGVPERDTACWEIPADPTLVAGSREKAVACVSAWGLDELAFTTELVVSELVTNAVRYGGGVATVRLIREKDRLVCEVSDPSSTAPHLKRARETDEGGRGLFIAARLVSRWGVRYTPTGKTIWTEQKLPHGRGGAGTSAGTPASEVAPPRGRPALKPPGPEAAGA